MTRRLFTTASLAAISFAFTACDGGEPLTGWLPSDTDSANEVFQNRVALAFPDGTRVAVVDAALKAERLVSSRMIAGFRPPAQRGHALPASSGALTTRVPGSPR